MSRKRKRTRMLLVGCGSMARDHVKNILLQRDTTRIAAICEPSQAMLKVVRAAFRSVGVRFPASGPELKQILKDHADEFDAAFIITPHAFHLEQALMCMEAGLDVLLEKPMVMNAAEARTLIQARDRTGRLLVVAFQGSLSPQIRAAVGMLRASELGTLLNIHGVVWQNWRTATEGTWRQQPELAGGGFLFDTGAHLLNTTADLAGEEFAEVAAWLDPRGAQVDVLGTVMARLQSGAYVTLAACGDSFPACQSDIRVICTEGMLRTDMWGERLEVRPAGEPDLAPVTFPPSLGVWEQFLAVRSGKMANPCPPEVGLRMARLWDAIQASSREGGRPVRLELGVSPTPRPSLADHPASPAGD